MSSYTESSVKTYVDTRFGASTSYADAARTQLNTYLTNLSTAITTFTGQEIDFTSVVFPAVYNPGAVTGVLPNAPVVPAVGTEDMPDAPTLATPVASFPAAPVAPALVTPVAAFGNAPTLATAIDISPAYPELANTLLTSLASKLTSSKALSAAEEQALYDRAIGRTEAENQRVEAEVLNLWGSRGYEIPQGVIDAQLTQIRTEQTRNNLEINAEILAKSAELAYRGATDVIAQAVNYTLNYMRTLLDEDIAKERAIVDRYSAEIQKYLAAIQGESSRIGVLADIEKTKAAVHSAAVTSYDSAVKAETARISTLAEIEKVKAALYEAAVRGVGVKTDAEVAAAKAAVDIYVGQLTGYELQVKASATSEQLKLSANELATKNAVAKKEVLLKEAELRIRESANTLQIQLDALKGGAQVNAQIVASALSSFNSNISYGFTGGWNDNYSTDLSKATVSESIIHNLTT